MNNAYITTQKPTNNNFRNTTKYPFFGFPKWYSSINGTLSPLEISRFHDYGQEFALSLLYYLEIGRNHRQKWQKQRNMN